MSRPPGVRMYPSRESSRLQSRARDTDREYRERTVTSSVSGVSLATCGTSRERVRLGVELLQHAERVYVPPLVELFEARVLAVGNRPFRQFLDRVIPSR